MALQYYAEGKITLDQIPTKYRDQIMKTTEYTRKQYDNWLERVNEARELVGKNGKTVALLIQRDDARIFVPVPLG